MRRIRIRSHAHAMPVERCVACLLACRRCAAAILCMCLSEQYKDAKPSMYAYQVAALLQHDRNAVQQHIRRYDALLAGMLELLPFSTGGGGGGAGVEGVRHAGVLLKLHELARKAEKSQQGQGQIPQLQGSGQAGQQGQ